MGKGFKCEGCGFAPLDDGAETAVCPRCGGLLSRETTEQGETKELPEEERPKPETALQGRRIGNYEIIEEVSRGAMGVIFKCRQTGLNRIVALKLLIAGEHASETQVERFKREAQAAARLRHPNIVPIHEIGVFEDKHFFTMDFIEGENLATLMRQGDISTYRALEICAQVADALHYAHSHNVIHRDVKPGNIIIDSDGRALVTDFGLAKFLDTDTKFTKTGTALGTPAYMSPEQASGKAANIDHRADIYSLGAVLYEMLTAQPPFSGTTMMETIMKVIHDDPTPPKKLNPRIHRDIQTIVLKAMEKDPSRRYQTAKDFADDIRRFLAGEAITARPASLLYKGYRKLAKYKSAIVAVLITIAVGLAIANIVRETYLPDPRELEQQERLIMEAERTILQTERLKEPTWEVSYQDDFADSAFFAKHWKVIKPGWLVKDSKLLFSGSDGAVYVNQPFRGNLRLDFDLLPISAPEMRLKCTLLSRKPMRSYNFTIGRQRTDEILLDDARQEIAGVKIPELKQDQTYHISVQKKDDAIEISLSDSSSERRLRYRDIRLLTALPSIILGLESWSSRLAIDKFTVTKEFPPLAANPVLVADRELFAGRLDVAAAEYADYAQVYAGKEPAIQAKYRLGVVHELKGEMKEAAETYEEVEQALRGMDSPKLRALRSQNAFRLFYCLVSLGQFEEAVEVFRTAVSVNNGVDPGYFWYFSGLLERLRIARKYKEALQIIKTCSFSPDGANLQKLSMSAHPPTRQTLERNIVNIGSGLADADQPTLVMELYQNFPMEALSIALERAISSTLSRKALEDCIRLLAFCNEREIKNKKLASLAVRMAKALVASKEPMKLLELYSAYPDDGEVSAFADGVAQLASADPKKALELLRRAVEYFPDKLNQLSSAGKVVAATLVSSEKPSDFVKVCELFVPDPQALKEFKQLCLLALQNSQKGSSFDQALSLLSYAREYFPDMTDQLTKIALGISEHFINTGDSTGLKLLYKAFPSDALAPRFAQYIKTTAENDLEKAIDFFSYIRTKYPEDKAIAESALVLRERTVGTDFADALLGFYNTILKELGEDLTTSAQLAIEAGDFLAYLGRREEAVIAYGKLIATNAPIEDADRLIAAYRISSIQHNSNEEEKSYWSALARLYPDASLASSITALMISPQTEESIVQWVKKNAPSAPSGDVEFLGYIRANQLSYPELAQRLAEQALRKVGPAPWFFHLLPDSLTRKKEE